MLISSYECYDCRAFARACANAGKGKVQQQPARRICLARVAVNLI